jgi:hypothetical protein
MSVARAGRGYPYVGVAFQPGNRVSLALTGITHGISHVMEAMPRRRKHAQLALHNQPASNQVRTPLAAAKTIAGADRAYG